MRRLTTDQFILNSKKLHGSFYDYSLVEYISSNDYVQIICPIHGIFNQKARKHSEGSGCFQCGKNRSTNEDFILKARIIHNDTYDYSLSVYLNNNTKVSIICTKCNNTFTQTPGNHLSGKGCNTCSIIRGGIRKSKSALSKKPIILDQPEDYKLIIAGENTIVKVDNDDFHLVRNINWTITKYGYVRNAKYGFIHRFVTKCDNKTFVDHIYHDKLDNRKKHLRLCSNQQNCMNQKPHKNCTSKYKGVSWDRERSKWVARICINYAKKQIGRFDSEVDAAKAYDEFAKKLHKEFAYLNFK